MLLAFSARHVITVAAYNVEIVSQPRDKEQETTSIEVGGSAKGELLLFAVVITPGQ